MTNEPKSFLDGVSMPYEHLTNQQAIELIAKFITENTPEEVSMMEYFCIDIDQPIIFKQFTEYLSKMKYEGALFPYEVGEEEGIPYVKMVEPKHFLVGASLFDSMYNGGELIRKLYA